jgi:hypothetical protein
MVRVRWTRSGYWAFHPARRIWFLRSFESQGDGVYLAIGCGLIPNIWFKPESPVSCSGYSTPRGYDTPLVTRDERVIEGNAITYMFKSISFASNSVFGYVKACFNH